MAHKTFISYKYSEGQELRDKIIESLGDDTNIFNKDYLEQLVILNNVWD